MIYSKELKNSRIQKLKAIGFTMIELIVGVGIIGILAATGAAIFLRSLRGASQTEIRRSLDDRARLITGSLSRFLYEGEAVSLDGQTRSVCLTAGGSLTGDSLVVSSLDGLSSTISVADGVIASAAAETVYLNPESVTVDYKTGRAYYFTWYCQQGVPDRLVMEFTATSLGQQGDTSVNSDYVIDVTMRNSGQ